MDAKKRAAVVRLRTHPRSRLTHINLARMLARPEAWHSLPPDVQQRLYALLPSPMEHQAEHDPTQHPFSSAGGTQIEEACVKWQQELGLGYHTKTHRAHKVQTVDEDLPSEAEVEGAIPKEA